MLEQRGTKWMIAAVAVALFGVVPVEVEAICEAPEPQILWSNVSDGGQMVSGSRLYLHHSLDAIESVELDGQALQVAEEGTSHHVYDLGAMSQGDHNLRVIFAPYRYEGEDTQRQEEQEIAFTVSSQAAQSVMAPQVSGWRSASEEEKSDLCGQVLWSLDCYDNSGQVTGQPGVWYNDPSFQEVLTLTGQPVAWKMERWDKEAGSSSAIKTTLWPGSCAPRRVLSFKEHCYRVSALNAVGDEAASMEFCDPQPANPATSEDDDGGCSATGQQGPAGGGALLILLALLGLRSRRD